MKEISFFRDSHYEGKVLNTTVFLPEEGAPKAVIVLLHGLAEHFGRYRRFAESLTAEGFALCGHDHLGHGEAVPEEERGFFRDKDGWETVCRDGASLVKAMRKDYPDSPIILMGHSMGSFMARTIYLRGLVPIDGLILSGTGNMSRLIVTGGKLVGKWIALWRGKDKVSPMLTSLALGAYVVTCGAQKSNVGNYDLPRYTVFFRKRGRAHGCCCPTKLCQYILSSFFCRHN